MTAYEKIGVLFKALNHDLYEWVVRRSEEEDMSMSAFIVRSLKKIRKLEESGDGNEKV